MDGDEHESYDQTDDSLLDDIDISGSTPRTARPKSRSGTNTKPNFANYPSPYEALKHELKGEEKALEDGDDTQVPPRTPGTRQRLPDMSMTPESPFEPTSYLPSATQRRAGRDPLLHRVLDKNYRIQATPHTTRKEQKTPANKPSWRDTTSPMSSPPVEAPQLHAEIFSSPIRQKYNKSNAPRTPGISVQTPAKGKAKDFNAKPPKKDEISWESDSDEDEDDVYKELGMSPPKTIQFVFPQSKLLQTPGKHTTPPLQQNLMMRLAREASKRIVEDLLATAGAGLDDTDALEDSPSLVAMKDDLDDSF